MARARTTTGRNTERDPWAEALAHLKRADPYVAELIERVGPCRLEPRADRFGTLVRAIIGQQISSRAAASIDARLRALAGETHEPAALLAQGETGLRSVGLSGVKARYVLNLATAVHNGDAPLDQFADLERRRHHRQSDRDQGRGPVDGRDVPHLRAQPSRYPPGRRPGRSRRPARSSWTTELPKPSHCHPLAEHLRPYRSIASWYFWRAGDAK